MASYAVVGSSSTVIGSMGSAMVDVGMKEPSTMNGMMSFVSRIPVTQISWKIFLATAAGTSVMVQVGEVVKSEREFLATRSSRMDSSDRPLTDNNLLFSESTASS